MENISPTLELLLEVKSALDSGLSLRTGIKRFLELSHSPFKNDVLIWLQKFDHQQNTFEFIQTQGLYRRSLLIILEKGLNGAPISQPLDQLEKEVISACETEMEDFIKSLPFKLLIPLLLFMFPAYLILLFGPFLENIINTL